MNLFPFERPPRHDSFMRWLASDAVVLGMAADPEPEDAVGCVDCQRAIVSADASGVEPANSFEMQ